jgi:hypothetical protein
MRMIHRWLAVFSVAAAMMAEPSRGLAQARINPDQPDMPVDAATRRAVIDGILSKLDGQYVIPAVGKTTR